MSSLFDVPDACEGCGKPEQRAYISYGGVAGTDRAYIRWMPLLEAYVCVSCVEAYSRWATSPIECEEEGNYRVPQCVTNIEERRKAQCLTTESTK